jgi:hypothetical protein
MRGITNFTYLLGAIVALTGLVICLAGSATNVQFMVKDSKKYAATGGWGFAQFKDGKPNADAVLLKTCFPCHEPIKARDYVFTHYAPNP